MKTVHRRDGFPPRSERKSKRQMPFADVPIGVFDSGIGGLTVYRALRAQLPDENFVYLGDTARLPYGTKSKETVCRYAERVAHQLFEEDIKLLVVACNTASAAALSYLKERWPDMPILGVVEPGAQAAVAASKTGRVVVFATEGTIRSGAYQREIQKRAPDMQVQGIACNLLVSLVEEGWGEGAEAEGILRRYLKRITLDGYDVLALGCTHFPVLVPALRSLLPRQVSLVDSAETTAQVVAQYLQENSLKNRASGGQGDRFLVTDCPERFSALAPLFLGGSAVDNVELIAL